MHRQLALFGRLVFVLWRSSSLASAASSVSGNLIYNTYGCPDAECSGRQFSPVVSKGRRDMQRRKGCRGKVRSLGNHNWQFGKWSIKIMKQVMQMLGKFRETGDASVHCEVIHSFASVGCRDHRSTSISLQACTTTGGSRSKTML